MRALQSSRFVTYNHLCREDHDTDDEHNDRVDHHNDYDYARNNSIFAGFVSNVCGACLVDAFSLSGQETGRCYSASGPRNL